MHTIFVDHSLRKVAPQKMNLRRLSLTTDSCAALWSYTCELATFGRTDFQVTFAVQSKRRGNATMGPEAKRRDLGTGSLLGKAQLCVPACILGEFVLSIKNISYRAMHTI